MKTRYTLWMAVLLALAASRCPARTLYVDLNSTSPVPPYAGWSSAAANIQDAIDASTNGDLILVNDGVYAAGGRIVYGALTNRVVINKAVMVQSVNGPAVTMIQGTSALGDSAVRCVYMTNNAALIGFTITNGATRSAGDATEEQSAGGIYCESNDDLIANCILTANVAQNNAGGIYQGTLTNCILQYNSCGSFNVGVGGGAWNSVLISCALTGNSAGHFGGGAYGSTLDDCTLNGNSAVIGGATHTCVVRDCVLADNSGVAYGGGAYGSSLTNCLVISNTVSCSYCGFSAGIGGGANSCSLDNCTVVGNYANWYAGGVDAASQVNNCIVYYNTSASAADENYQSGMALNYSCTTPMPGGTGNITNAPLFMNLTGDFHLQSNSPCINLGNNVYAAMTNDLDGNARIVGDGVDMGAYEYQASIPLTVAIQAGPTNVATGAPLPMQGLLQGGTADLVVWDFGDGTTASNQLSVSHAWNLPGSYAVTLMVSNAFTPGGARATTFINASNAPPAILQQPASQFSVLFSNVTFTVNADGSWPLTYQWQFDGTALPAGTNASLTLTNLQLSNEGTYDVIVSNAFGSVTSSNAFLSISRIVIWGSPSNQPPGLTNVMSITGYPAALRHDRTVVWWSGSLQIPIVVYGLSNVVAVATSYNYQNVALLMNGNVVLWTTDGAFKLAGSGSSNAVAITGDNYGDLELRSNGTLAGSVLSGAPLSVANVSNAVAIAEGLQHSLALKADGTVLAWGNNGYGQASVPLGLSNVMAIAAGGYHSMALKNNGTVIAWGANVNQQTNVPPGLSNVVAIAAGEYHSLALKGDGTVVAWGWNNDGQTNVPPGLSNVVAIAAGQYDSLALVGNGPPVLQAPTANPVAGSNDFSLTVPTQPGRVYDLEFKRGLNATNWTALPLSFGTGTNLVLTDSTATNSPRFYRVLQW